MNLSEYFQLLFPDITQSLITITGVLLMIPLFTMYKGYKITKSLDYLILLGIFILFPVHWLTIPFHDFTKSSVRIWYVFFVTFLTIFEIVHAIRLRWHRPPRWLYPVLGIEISLFLFIGIFWSLDPSIMPNFWVFFEPIRMTLGILILYTYSTFDPVKNDRMINYSRRLWQLLGVFMIYGAIGYFLVHLPNAPTYPAIIALSAKYQNIYMQSFLLFLSLKYPQYLLISKAQIVRACNAYKLVHITKEKEQFSQLGMNKIRNYIKSVPETVFEEDCLQVTSMSAND